MNILSRLFGTCAPSKAPASHLPDAWLPIAKMKRVILHWTGGSYVASSLDKEHYHFLIEGGGNAVRGKHSIGANENIGGQISDHYAAHTRGANTGAIGVSICAMAGGQERPFKSGKYPLTELQWQRAAEVVAQLCEEYDIPVTSMTVLTHAEVQPNLGIAQSGKWDVAKLSFNQALTGAKACGDDFRQRVKDAMR